MGSVQVRIERPTHRRPIGRRRGLRRVRRRSHSALDPPRSAASPAVPALIGSGSPLCCYLQLAQLLKFGQDLWMAAGEVANNACVAEQS